MMMMMMMIQRAMINLRKENCRCFIHLFQLSCAMLMDQTYLPVKLLVAAGEGQIPLSFTSKPSWE